MLGMCTMAFAGPFVPNFNSLTVGTAVPFSVVDGATGVTATYSSPDGSVFTVAQSFFSFGGNVLLDADPSIHVLNISFSSPITSFSTVFALDGAATDQLNLTAYLGASTVGSTSAWGTVPGGFYYPEGTLSYSSAGGFDQVSLVSTAQDFAIGLGDATPEPGTGLLFAGGAVALVFLRRFRS